MEKLQELFYYYIQSEHYKGRAESTGTLEAWDCYIETTADMPEEMQTMIADIISNYGREREELGFVNGFRYGVGIIIECVTTNKRI